MATESLFPMQYVSHDIQERRDGNTSLDEVQEQLCATHSAARLQRNSRLNLLRRNLDWHSKQLGQSKVHVDKYRTIHNLHGFIQATKTVCTDRKMAVVTILVDSSNALEKIRRSAAIQTHRWCFVDPDHGHNTHKSQKFAIEWDSSAKVLSLVIRLDTFGTRTITKTSLR